MIIPRLFDAPTLDSSLRRPTGTTVQRTVTISRLFIIRVLTTMWGDLNHIILDDNDEWVLSDDSDDEDGNQDGDNNGDDDEDDGFGSAESEPEDVIVDITEPEPQGETKPYQCEPSLPPTPWFSPSMNRRSHPYARHMWKITSMGFDDDNMSRVRNHVRCSKVFNGEGMLENGLHQPKKITGMAVKRKRILYFVQWSGKGKVSIPVEAELMRNRYPHLVLEYHEKAILKPNIYKNM
ncbi:hypothetical protein ACI65C_006358 [Semiaphis heraclei]